MIKKLHSAPLFLALALAWATPHASAQTYVWDGSTSSGYQNTNGTWGTDNFWTTNSGAGSGTVLTAWTNTATAWLGGNSTTAASPSTNVTITVSGTQVAFGIRQIQLGAGNFTLTGGEIQANSFRADTNTLTINSVIGSYTVTNNARVDFSAQPAAGTLLILGGNNTLTNNVGIAGASSGGGTVRLNHQNALGLGSSVIWVHDTALDLNGFTITNKTITVNNTRTAFLLNSGAGNAVWSGNVVLTNTPSNVGFRAGGTNGEVEVTGVISGTSNNTVQSFDSGRLRLSGANTYDGDTSVRTSSTLIVGHASALGSTNRGTFVGTSATLDLNGFNVGNEAITLQQTSSRLVNSNTTTAATVAGNITNTASTSVIGGPGNLTLSGSLSSGVASGFSKAGTGTVTLSGGTANTLSGTVTVGEGTLKLDKTPGVNAIAGNLTISNSAVLLVAQSDQVNNSSAVTLSGGTIQRGSGVNETFGALTLGANSTIDFGTGATGTLAFQPGIAGGFTPGANTLTVQNFLAGNILSFGSSSALFTVGTYAGGYTGSGFNFGTQGFTASFASSTFTITAIPEPSTVLAAIGLAGLMLWPVARRKFLG
jgi:autotransporter-associated beta strand protein